MLTYIITACMMTLMMSGSSLGEDQKPQMEIDLEGTTDIVPPLTQSLNLTCSLVPATGSDPEDKKADFKTITGVYINLKATDRREEEDVAKITISDPDNATLSGLLPRATIIEFGLSEGFIKVGVAAPDSKHAGEYTCKVTGNNTDEDPVTLTHKASVRYTAPDVEDLAKYIHKMELQQEEKNALLEEKDALLEKKDASQDENVASQISNIKTKNGDQDTDISNIETKNRNQDTEINKRVSKSDIQQGEAGCYPGTGESTDERQVSFPHRYSSKAPKVFLSVRSIWGNAAYNPDGSYTDDDTGTEYYMLAQPVTQTGFTLRCTVYRYSYIYYMSVNWIAFPSP